MVCDRHPYDQAAGTCRMCGSCFCAECLVWADGDHGPAACIRCALRAPVDRRPTRRSRLLARA